MDHRVRSCRPDGRRPGSGSSDRRPGGRRACSVRGVQADGESPGADLPELAASALAGDRRAWEALVDRLSGTVWAAVRRVDMPAEDRKDAFASTFLRLYERLGAVQDPERLHGWVATTARREALAITRARRRETPVELVDAHLASVPDVAAERLLDGELSGALRAAFRQLPEACQRLLALLSADPPPSYNDVCRVLGMPIGSIGPTRRRCLTKLRRMPELQAFGGAV